MDKITVFRALSSVLASKMLSVAKLVLSIGTILLLLITWSLASFVDALWWLLLIVVLPLIALGWIIYAVASLISKQIYPKKLTKQQHRSLSNFVDKTLRVLETRAMPPGFIAVIVIKDLLAHRSLKTFKNLLNDTTTLSSDFTKLQEDLRYQA